MLTGMMLRQDSRRSRHNHTYVILLFIFVHRIFFMSRYMLKCRLCDSSFMNYESYERHVVEQHQDNLAYRFKPMMIESEG